MRKVVLLLTTVTTVVVVVFAAGFGAASVMEHRSPKVQTLTVIRTVQPRPTPRQTTDWKHQYYFNVCLRQQADATVENWNKCDRWATSMVNP